MWWVGDVAGIGEKRTAHRSLVRKPEEEEPLGRPRRKWMINIKTYLAKIELCGVDWIALVQGRDNWRVLVNAVMNVRIL
jgi:hypothetical protein